MRYYLASTLLLLSATAIAAESTLEIRHREKNGVGYDQGYTSFDYNFFNSWHKPELLINLRAHLFNDARFAANAGIGIRQPLKHEQYLLGANIFYDYRESKHLKTQQIGAGFEFLTSFLDVRMNGYYPLTDTAYDRRKFDEFSGHAALFTCTAIAALPCIDFELGIPVSRHVYLAGGSYYLFQEKIRRLQFGDAWGGKLRIAFDLGRYVYAGGDVTYDHIFHTKVQGYIGLKIPIGSGQKEKPAKRHLRLVPIVRNEIIPLEKKHSTYPLALGIDEEEPVRLIFVDNSFEGQGNGSFEAPFSSFKAAEASSQPNDIIYVFPGDGTPHNMDQGIILQDNQILASSSAPLEIADVIIPPATPGESPVITNIHPNEPIISNPGASHIQDFVVKEPWEYLLEDGNLSIDPLDELSSIGLMDSNLNQIDESIISIINTAPLLLPTITDTTNNIDLDALVPDFNIIELANHPKDDDWDLMDMDAVAASSHHPISDPTSQHDMDTNHDTLDTNSELDRSLDNFELDSPFVDVTTPADNDAGGSDAADFASVSMDNPINSSDSGTIDQGNLNIVDDYFADTTSSLQNTQPNNNTTETIDRAPAEDSDGFELVDEE